VRITVVIPTFNSMKYVDQCLDSVLAQTYEDMEIVVYDNESTDGTYEHLLGLEDDRLKVVSIPNIYPNGYREAIDHVFENTDSDYVTFISSDDYLDNSYISNYMSVLNDHDPEIKCIQSGLFWVNEKGEEVNRKFHKYNSIEEFKKLCLVYCPVNNPTVVYHRSLGPILSECREAHFKNNLPDIGVGDYDMWCGLADRGIPIYPITGYLGYYYRWHQEQCTWKVQQNPVDYDKLIKEYWEKKWKLDE